MIVGYEGPTEKVFGKSVYGRLELICAIERQLRYLGCDVV